MENINIQSISDLITNSSTEAFVVYDAGNIEDIKNLVNAILSLLDPSKTFDDYFTIEMQVNYDGLNDIFNELCTNEELYENYPELEGYSTIEDYLEQDKYLRSLSTEVVEGYFDYYNEDIYYDNYKYLYEGFLISAKVDDPIVQKVASVINNIDNIFNVDYSSNY